MAHSELLRKMKIDATTFHQIVQTLRQQRDIEASTQDTTGRTGTVVSTYRRVKQAGDGSENADGMYPLKNAIRPG